LRGVFWGGDCETQDARGVAYPSNEIPREEQSEVSHILATLEQICLLLPRLNRTHTSLAKPLAAGVTRRLQAFTQPERYNFWLEPENQRSNKSLRLIAVPRDIPSRLADSLWRKRLPILLLDNSNKMLHTKRLLGLDQIMDGRLREVCNF